MGNMEVVIQAITIMWQGMLGILVVMSILSAVVALLPSFDKMINKDRA